MIFRLQLVKLSKLNANICRQVERCPRCVFGCRFLLGRLLANLSRIILRSLLRCGVAIFVCSRPWRPRSAQFIIFDYVFRLEDSGVRPLRRRVSILSPSRCLGRSPFSWRNCPGNGSFGACIRSRRRGLRKTRASLFLCNPRIDGSFKALHYCQLLIVYRIVTIEDITRPET